MNDTKVIWRHKFKARRLVDTGHVYTILGVPTASDPRGHIIQTSTMIELCWGNMHYAWSSRIHPLFGAMNLNCDSITQGTL